MTLANRLLIFTRYPIAGKAKTRLIPALGAQGAADLQQQMTEHTLRQVQLLKATFSLSVEVWFAGTGLESEQDDNRMQTWLGSQWLYQAQSDGDLGDRLIHAIQAAFDAGMQRVVTIGTDCPGLGATQMQQAFQALSHSDIVLGPAIDGGYYLIGLRQFVPALFVGIDWGSETVLQQTVEIAMALDLTIAYLDPLTDVDRPEDLGVWQAIQQEKAGGVGEAGEAGRNEPNADCPLISVIIPVLDEAALIEEVLRSLPLAAVEVIVVDGGSQDRTVELAMAMGVKVIVAEPGRAIQMNAGAKVATGEILLFLHADTRLPKGFISFVQQTLAQPRTIAGAFALTIAGKNWGLRWIEQSVKWRSRLLQLPYGDQAIFLKTKTFQQLGGFAKLPIMEDFEFVRRLQKYGKIVLAPAAIVTSGRRWHRLGVLRTTLLNQIIIAAYLLKVPPERIAKWYWREKKGERAGLHLPKLHLLPKKNRS